MLELPELDMATEEGQNPEKKGVSRKEGGMEGRTEEAGSEDKNIQVNKIGTDKGEDNMKEKDKEGWKKAEKGHKTLRVCVDRLTKKTGVEKGERKPEKTEKPGRKKKKRRRKTGGK